MGGDVFRQAGELSANGEAFSLVTVVWRRGPTSGKEGARSIVTADGRVHGWLGGACSEPSVVEAALAAMRDGRSRLLFLGPADEFDGIRRPGVIAVPMACESEGAMEVHIEPVLPEPQVVVIGRSPAAQLLVRLAQELRWRSLLIDDRGSHDLDEDFAGVSNVSRHLDLADVDERTFIVVATQGHYDEQALEAALGTSALYVGLIASEKRAASVKEYLRAKGVSDEAIARVRAPAGVDLGHVAHDEIAVSVLAELVALRATGGLPGVVAATPATVRDPVCDMTVNLADARFVAEHAGSTYYFCAAGCQRAFEANPSEFLPT